jgi:hypothetical protein
MVTKYLRRDGEEMKITHFTLIAKISILKGVFKEYVY